MALSPNVAAAAAEADVHDTPYSQTLFTDAPLIKSSSFSTI
jgi:hypothetical protein